MTGQAYEAVNPCPCCGVYSEHGQSLAQPPVLLAVSYALVVKALEKVGKMLARNGGNRGRVRLAESTPFYLAHTVIRPQPRDIDKGLHGAWDIIPLMLNNHGCCGVTPRQMEEMIDSYARDLLITGTGHSMSELRYRFQTFLGVQVAEPEPYRPGLDGGRAGCFGG